MIFLLAKKTAGATVTNHILNRNDSMFMAPSLPTDTFKIILALKNTKSVGYDGVSTEIIKTVADIVCGPLCHIMNLSIGEGMFPNALKKSIVKPLHKKQEKYLM